VHDKGIGVKIQKNLFTVLAPVTALILPALLLAGLVLLGAQTTAAQTEFTPEQTPEQTPIQTNLSTTDRIERFAVIGNERIEASTIASYLSLRPGDLFDPARIDESLKTLFATGLFADVIMERDGSSLVVRIVENPIINRIVFEGNSRLDREDLMEEVELRPRMVYTRARVRADVQRILDLYRRKGRFAAVVEPMIIERDQNRVDLVFEISEGPKSRVSKINFIGNDEFGDRKLRSELATKQARWWNIFTSEDTYDPDRLDYDRELLRQFYLRNGYADFRVVSAVAELTPDQNDFFITYVVDEGETYHFGEIKVESEIRDLSKELLSNFVTMKTGELYDADKIDSTQENMGSAAGILGFAFLDVRPQISRNREDRTLDITFHVMETPRAYVERVEIHGNVRTLDRVIRREFRLTEGDAFNTLRVDRSEARLNSLGFFRAVTIEPQRGSEPGSVVLDVTVEEQATGELSFGIGFSSLENFILDMSVRERNLLGRGQDLRLGVSMSGRRKQINLGFTEPRFLGRNMSAGFDLFRTELDSYTESSFSTTSTGLSLNTVLPLSEYVRLGTRYTLRRDEVNTSFFTSSPFVRDSQGKHTTSSVGYTLIYDSVDHFMYPTRGMRIIFGQDLAGVGGTVNYLRTSMTFDRYINVFNGWILNFGAEYGYINGLGSRVRINDRFFLGGPKMRGFNTAGIGPRDTTTGDFLGGNLYYVANASVQLPLGRSVREMGVRVDAFVDIGSLAKLDLLEFDSAGNPIDNSTVFSNGAPRVAVGIGMMWESPFGPFRIDLAKAIRKQPWDKTQTLQFNVGTVF